MSSFSNDVTRGFAYLTHEMLNGEFESGRLREVTVNSTMSDGVIPVWSRSLMHALAGGLGQVLVWANVAGMSLTQQSTVISARCLDGDSLLDLAVDEMLADAARRLSVPYVFAASDMKMRAYQCSSAVIQSHEHAQLNELVLLAATDLNQHLIARWVYRGIIGLLGNADGDSMASQKEFVHHMEQWFSKAIEGHSWASLHDLAKEPTTKIVERVNVLKPSVRSRALI